MSSFFSRGDVVKVNKWHSGIVHDEKQGTIVGGPHRQSKFSDIDYYGVLFACGSVETLPETYLAIVRKSDENIEAGV